jgi:hypothetical protein
MNIFILIFLCILSICCSKGTSNTVESSGINLEPSGNAFTIEDNILKASVTDSSGILSKASISNTSGNVISYVSQQTSVLLNLEVTNTSSNSIYYPNYGRWYYKISKESVIVWPNNQSYTQGYSDGYIAPNETIFYSHLWNIYNSTGTIAKEGTYAASFSSHISGNSIRINFNLKSH